MRRSLVITDETAGHPFLASLPPHVRTGIEPVTPRPRWRVGKADLRGFFAAYCASLVVALILIA